MHLERIIRAQTNIQPHFEELLDRISLVCEEERVIAQGAHRHPDLLQVEEVLERRDFAEQDPVRDGV